MRRTVATVLAGLLISSLTVVAGESAEARTGAGTCPAPSVATRTTGTVTSLSPTKLRVHGHTDYYKAGVGWVAMDARTYRVAVQKQQGSAWRSVTSVVPDRTTQIKGTRGVYRLAYLRNCTTAGTAAYGASSGTATKVTGKAPKPAVRKPVVRKPAPKPVVTPPKTGSGSYANCTEARAAGVTPLHRGQPGYSPALDRDGDGVACE
jgi:Excalibur calcium-binding domain